MSNRFAPSLCDLAVGLFQLNWATSPVITLIFFFIHTITIQVAIVFEPASRLFEPIVDILLHLLLQHASQVVTIVSATIVVAQVLRPRDLIVLHLVADNVNSVLHQVLDQVDSALSPDFCPTFDLVGRLKVALPIAIPTLTSFN